MSLIEYVPKKFTAEHLELIGQSNAVITDFKGQGYSLTLRQVYYQLVGLGIIPNTLQSYKRLGSILNDARLAGLVDWDAMEDRTRGRKGGGGWDSPQQVLRTLSYGYHVDRWLDQECHVEVWVEKEALESVVSRAAGERNVPYLCCRGYLSQTEMHESAMRMVEMAEAGKNLIVIYIGDHDPSGIDMTRDVEDRLNLFLNEHLGGGYSLDVLRLALNRDQVDEYNLPPNPAKITDSRAVSYIAQHGHSSWELDAIRPQVLHAMITAQIEQYLDIDLYNARGVQEREERAVLVEIAQNWQEVFKLAKSGGLKAAGDKSKRRR